jgi:hypothetical protein
MNSLPEVPQITLSMFSANQFRARNGIELSAEPETARRGCLVGHVKSFEVKSETITSSLWTSLLAKLLLRPKNRSPLPVRRSLERRNVAASKQQSECCQSFSGGESVGSHAPTPKGEACNSVAGEVISDAGSTPAASTIKRVLCGNITESDNASVKPKSDLEDT